MAFRLRGLPVFLALLASFPLCLWGQTSEIPVPLVYWGEIRGEVRIRVNPRTGVLNGVHREALLLMEGSTYTTPSTLDRMGAGEFPTLAQWREAGWDFVLNPETVTLAVVLAPEAERPRILSLNRPASPETGQFLKGALWSAVLNGAAEARLVNSPGTAEEEGLDWEALLTLSFALRGGWSLWSSADLDSRRSPAVDFPEVRFMKDFPEDGLVLSLGFLPARGQSWVQSPALWGASFGTDFTLRPEMVTQSSGNHILFLQEASTLTVRQNGQVTGRLTVPAGPLELRDIPLRQGINRVDLEVTGPTGRTGTLAIELPFLSTLLAPGVLEYHTSLGMEQNYPDNFRWSLQARRGIWDFLTLGGGVQGDRDEILAAGEAALAVPAGSFRFDFGLGTEETVLPLQVTGAAGVQYDWQHASQPGLPRFGLGLQWKSEGFRSPVRNRTSRPEETLGVTGSVTVPVLGAAMATFLGRTQWHPRADKLQHQLSGILSMHMGNSGIVTLRGAAELAEPGSWIWSTSLNWTLSPDASGFSGTVSQDLVRGETLVQASQAWEPDPFSQGSVSLGGSGMVPSGEFRSGSAGLRYQNPLVESSLFHTSDYLPGVSGFQHITRFRAASALAAADGLAALSRPVSGAFVLAEVLPEYRPFQPVLRSQTGAGAAPMMPWGTGILANLKAYQTHKISPDSTELPPGYNWGEETFPWKPERFQGARVVLGSRSIITLESRIVDQSGRTVALKAGNLRGEEGSPLRLFFTNRQGQFMVPGLAPGDYTLTLVDGRSAKVTVGDPPSRVEELSLIQVE